MKLYNAKYKDSTELEVVLYDVTKDKEQSVKWAQQEKFPWPVLLHFDPKVKEAEFLFEEHFEKFVPHYILVDGEGNLRSRGSEADYLLDLL